MKKWDDYSLVSHARFALWVAMAGAAGSMVLYVALGSPEAAWSVTFTYTVVASAVLLRLQQRLAREHRG